MPRQQVPVKRLGRPKDVASAETRERLLCIARRVFAREGYAATTNKVIAEGVGITTGAIYHYYPSKAELFAAVAEQVEQIVDRAFEQAIAPHDTLVDRFVAVLDAAVEMNRHDPSITGFIASVPAEARRHPDLRRLLRATRPDAPFLRRLAVDAAARGELRPDVSVRALEDLLTAVLAGLALYGDLRGGPERHAAAVAMLKRVLDGTLMA
ncbi:MAG: TetR/AcrR family transcriptional regulator [Acidimicrobiales bacterium]|nr:TetR/AcrR family transcriptional regulator [Acidimicrobiales bacterium]MCB9395047.1 TetR/AcrR family transcriptional regulator [Acidimicrobiaceae bacterium]